MLLSVCMKDYVARSYGHTPRKLPLKGVPSRATSRFIAYQAPQLYTILSFLSIVYKKYFLIRDIENSRIFKWSFVHYSQIHGIFFPDKALSPPFSDFPSKNQLKFTPESAKKCNFIWIVYFSLTISLYNMYIQLFSHIFKSRSNPNGAFNGTK